MSTARVQTRDGQLEGEQREGHLAFLGIPFAKPPVGALRFRAPQPVDAWSGVRMATAFGPSAPQSSTPGAGMSPVGVTSEDCLYLNVFTPATGARRRPVLFWVHGGAFTLGSGSSAMYDGAALCRRGDVVVVTINYRLGALGYAQLTSFGGERIGASANCGMLDQIAALRWVRDNIAEFGGDPGNVTLFGESAGATSVCMLTAAPDALGLYQRAVAQSPYIPVPAQDEAAQVAAGLFHALGLQPGDLDQLCALPAERIVEAQTATVAVTGMMRGFAPSEDPATLPLRPMDAVAHGRYAKVPLVIGSNRDEMNLFTAPLLPMLDKPMPDEKAIELLRRQLPSSASEHVPALLATYRASRERRGLPFGNRALIGAIDGDARFRIPSVRFAEAYRSAQPNTFMYLFTYESPAMRGAMRACHALEIPFVFGTLTAPGQDRFAGTGPAVEKLSEVMMECWLAFARSGDPAHLLAGDWPHYDSARRATMVFDKQTQLEDAPYEDERAAWDGVEF